MSRYEGSDEESYPNQAYLWAANLRRALKGQRGRKALAHLREALLALPEPRLISRALCTVGAKAEPDDGYEMGELLARQGEGVCAVGAYVWWQKVKAGMSPEEAFAALPMLADFDEGMSATVDEGCNAGLAGVLAWELAYRNDEHFYEMTPEQRHAAFVGWIDKVLAA